MVKAEQETREGLAERVSELDHINRLGELLQACFTAAGSLRGGGARAPGALPRRGRGGVRLQLLAQSHRGGGALGPHAAEQRGRVRHRGVLGASQRPRARGGRHADSGPVCTHLPSPAARRLSLHAAGGAGRRPRRALRGLHRPRAPVARCRSPRPSAAWPPPWPSRSRWGWPTCSCARCCAASRSAIPSPGSSTAATWRRRWSARCGAPSARAGPWPCSCWISTTSSAINDDFDHDAGDALLRETGRPAHAEPPA